MKKDHRTHSQEHHNIDSVEDRGAERESARLSSLMGREIIVGSQTKTATVLKAKLKEIYDTRSGVHMGFPERVDTILT